MEIDVTAGGGGATTNDNDLGIRAKHLTTQLSSSQWEYIHNELAYNCRMPNINALAYEIRKFENNKK